MEVGLAFRHRQIDGAVLALLRADAPYRILVELAESGIQYSMALLAVSRDFYRRSPRPHPARRARSRRCHSGVYGQERLARRNLRRQLDHRPPGEGRIHRSDLQKTLVSWNGSSQRNSIAIPGNPGEGRGHPESRSF
jgi:hypothetical protein